MSESSGSEKADQRTRAVEPQRIALLLQYVGTHFHGWQAQPQQRTVQAELEAAIAEIVGHPIRVTGAGRTDTGVHAAGQVAHFDVVSPIPAARWPRVINNRLPGDISITAAAVVGPDWHARFSATWRRYRYTLYTGSRPNLFVRPFSWHYYYAPLDVGAMRAALEPLLGRHHLAAFHRSNSNRDHSWVEVQAVTCQAQGPFIEIEVQANAFLYGMMRLLVGLLVQVGRRQRSPEEFTQLWLTEQREQVKYAAPPQGLCLLGVGYPNNLFLTVDQDSSSQPHFYLGQDFPLQSSSG
ncbi:tRNA pseudouridine(38-40) synthase TruA [Trichothermofontia sichuanensis B231]|nr:tRNA pseudouridine(38-40) synthase TruA [Trichothermofontia sichuanensis]UZQ56333.1 tRNA pseudouridine(38-40) synthase TruA [Trichothermofontia sichuanensis B231]